MLKKIFICCICFISINTFANKFDDSLKLAENGDALAQSVLAFKYANGIYVPQNYRNAVHWYSKAAEQGEVNAQRELAYMYEWGFGVRINLNRAARLYRKAAVQGDSFSQFRLGLFYYHGKSVIKNIPKALDLFEQAATNGDSEAQLMLGLLYGQDGAEVAKDTAKANKWLNAACASGHKFACDYEKQEK